MLLGGAYSSNNYIFCWPSIGWLGFLARLMALRDENIIDMVAHNSKTDIVSLVMVEIRHWGDNGGLIGDLVVKLCKYTMYVTDGQFAKDYPAYANKPIHFELRTLHPPTSRENKSLYNFTRRLLKPEGITCGCRLLNGEEVVITKPPPKKATKSHAAASLPPVSFVKM